ncbi:Sec-independent protein translocase subunit TatA [Rhodococcus sp. 14C212]|uniref:Sec-independent protein translocase subunit TatA n=1 Tax=Rhodococcus sp. 14C212 TaxID=2711209 RepID=UPI0013EBFFE5|nr:Sec-independent protein translocase subunit TatA [Rhodococcus sp. 14C212]NGP05721.1 Sec-independent protein translocase subunit TatA [Rhodococcus sp. 14C212]
MGAMSPWHWAIVALVVVVLFGSKKLPDAARGLGRSMRIFQSEVKEMTNEPATAPTSETTPSARRTVPGIDRPLSGIGDPSPTAAEARV